MRKEHLLPDKRLTPAAQPSEEDALSIKYRHILAHHVVLDNLNFDINTICCIGVVDKKKAVATPAGEFSADWAVRRPAVPVRAVQSKV